LLEARPSVTRGGWEVSGQRSHAASSLACRRAVR
jgi:hypothetical protein